LNLLPALSEVLPVPFALPLPLPLTDLVL